MLTLSKLRIPFIYLVFKYAVLQKYKIYVAVIFDNILIIIDKFLTNYK